jgi:aminoglycoside phosphotransferase (APT) family kinase protein
MSEHTALTGPLETLLARVLDDFVALDDLQQLTAGASQETYRVNLHTASADRSLALRRARPTDDSNSGVGGLRLETEAKLMALAGANGVPGPEILHILQPEDGLGAGFLMEWLEGETLGQRIVRSEQLAEVRPQLARECGRILGRIHNLDWQGAQLAGELPCVDPASLVEETFAIYLELSVPVPMIDYSWRWLRDNLPRESRRTLVHGDFRNGNLMVTPEGIRAVLDWELAQVGDPVRDLGWICVNSWRFGNSRLPVGGFGTVEDLLSGYREVTGVEVSSEQLTFWEVFGSFWWSIITLQMANAWRTGEAPSLERPVIGRRSSEAQMDCVNLLIPGDFDLPDTGRGLAEGTQLPMPAELLEGVAGFLRDDVAGQLDSHRNFLARVAANSLGIAQRELRYGAELAGAERHRLCSLLAADGSLDELRTGLSQRLREGLPLTTPGLADHLRRTVAGQLAIDQPGYSALSRST